MDPIGGVDVMNSATELARDLTQKIIENGIYDVVISPGSRSAPLSIALFQAQKNGLLKLHVRIDERTAAFFALGIAKASKKPVALLCTSGTAVANYHPAILEARHSKVPLLIFTADRPARLRQTGANQTTLQSSIFGRAVVYAADLSDATDDLSLALTGLSDGPVHINVQFDEPLLPDGSENWLENLSLHSWLEREVSKPEDFSISTPRGVVVVGHDHGGIDCQEIMDFASRLGWPLVAEDPLSFPTAIAHSALFLNSEEIRNKLAPDMVFVIGRTTLSRSTNVFIKSAKSEVVIDPRMNGVDQNRSGDYRFSTLPIIRRDFVVDYHWNAKWKDFSASAASTLINLPLWSEPEIARRISAALPIGTSLYIASSRPVRDIEAFATPRSGIETFANRGLAGIDGNISTALGIASQRESSVAIMGDLSFLHDLTGLISRHEIDLRILVINNDGGGIFSTLPQANVEGFEEIFGTPHGMNPANIARSLGVTATTVTDMQNLLREMSAPINGLSVVVAEVPNREENAQTIRAIYSEVAKI